MEIARSLNNNLTPPDDPSLLTLPNELIKKIICEFLPLSDVLTVRRVNKSVSRFLVDMKAREQRKFLERLHTTLLKSFLFLPHSLINDLEKIEISKNIESISTNFRDIDCYNRLWLYQVQEILGSMPSFIRPLEYSRETILKQLHPFCAKTLTPIPQVIHLMEEEGARAFLAHTFLPNFMEQKTFLAPPKDDRLELVLGELCVNLLSSLDPTRFSVALQEVLNGKYSQEWGDITIISIIKIIGLYGAPLEESLQLAKKIYSVTTREHYYWVILTAICIRGNYLLFYRLIEELFEESLSPRGQNTLIHLLAKINPSKAVERALTLQNESVQKQAFIDIFPYLHYLLFEGEAATKRMFTLMEKIKKEDRNDPVFEIMEMFQLIVEKDPRAAAQFWGPQSLLVVHMPEEHRTWNATVWIVEFQAAYQPDKLHACQRAYQILRNRVPQPSPSGYARPFFQGIYFSRDEIEALTVLIYFFEIATSPILEEFLQLLFLNFPSFLQESAPFFTKLDESIQKEEDRLWIEYQLYQHPVLTHPSPPLHYLLFWLHMGKRFCRDGDQKDQTMTFLLIKLCTLQPNPTASFLDDPNRLSFFQAIKNPRKKLEVLAALARQHLTKTMADTSILP